MLANAFNISEKITDCLKVANKYEWLLNSYVLDFYVDDHWHKLPLSWQRHLENVPIEALGELLQSCDSCRYVWPMELLALRQVLRKLCINREQQHKVGLPLCPLLGHPKLKDVFMRGVKLKKQYEITQMAGVCAQSYRNAKVDFVVDFGAGLGHLARILGYGYGIEVCCFEKQTYLNEQAALIDKRLEAVSAKHLSSSQIYNFKRPKHLTQCLEINTEPLALIHTLMKTMQLEDDHFSFGIIGLHPCGDLGALLMRMFLNCNQAKFLNFVGCCYQKLSTPQTHATALHHGYPLSKFLKQLSHRIPNSQLSYESREISCHATEMYYDRLLAGEYEYLKIHSFRAAAERIIVRNFPELKHCGLRSVKHTQGLSFHDYFYKAVQGTQVPNVDSSLLHNEVTKSDIKNWRRAVIFYTLRLMLAPLVESIILYDRMLFLIENGCEVQIDAIFDPRLSPRNHITSAVKS